MRERERERRRLRLRLWSRRREYIVTKTVRTTNYAVSFEKIEKKKKKKKKKKICRFYRGNRVTQRDFAISRTIKKESIS